MIGEVKIAAGRCYDVGHPSLNLREAAFPSWRFRELEDEVISCLTLAMKRWMDFEWSFEESLPHEWSTSSTYFPLTMNFLRFLQEQFCLEIHAFSRLWKTFVEQLSKGDSYNNLECLLLALTHELGALAMMIHIEVASHQYVFQLTTPNDSLKTMCRFLLPLLEGKQFERGGFVTSLLYM